MKRLFKKDTSKSLRLLVFAVAGLLFSLKGFAQPSCPSLLNRDLIKTNFNDSSEQQTVDIINEKNGRHGGRVLTLLKTGSTWMSKFSTFNFDVQGDPRWFIGALGEKQAEFFGFKLIDSNTMEMPNAEEFQGALNKVNKELVRQGHDPVEISYSTLDFKRRPLVSYLDSFDQNILPVASAGNHIIHDMSFHSGMIFIPNQYLQVAQRRVRFVRGFINQLLSSSNELTPLVAGALPQLRTLLVRGFDNGSAFGNLSVVAHKSADSLVQSRIETLISKMQNQRLEAEDTTLVSPLHLILGAYGVDKYYKDENIVYEVPTPDDDGITLERYATDLLAQILSTKLYSDSMRLMELNLHQVKLGKASSSDPLVPNEDYEKTTERIKAFLNSQMFQTHRGRTGQLF